MIKLSLYLGTLLLGTNFSATSVPTQPRIQATQMGISAAEQQFVALANAERQARGLSSLEINPLLMQVARQHSKEMCQMDYFDHTSPTAELATPMKRYLKTLGYVPKWARVGENLLYSSVVDPPHGHKCLIQSPKHRDNMLDPRFKQIGVGAYTSADGRFWVTQLFLAQEG